MVNADDLSCSFEAPVAVHLRDLVPFFTVSRSVERVTAPGDIGMD